VGDQAWGAEGAKDQDVESVESVGNVEGLSPPGRLGGLGARRELSELVRGTTPDRKRF